MPRLPLTDEQKTAATSRRDRLFIEANPGSGKTTVAAERYGILRFDRTSAESRAVTAISFTRSATGELNRRIRGRWGTRATGWPHGVMTIDRLVCDIVHHLLRRGLIHWLGDHATLEVLDEWRGHKGYRWLVPGNNYRRAAALDANARLTSVGRPVTTPGFGFGNKQVFHDHLALGRCTHEDVRSVLASALRKPNLKDEVTAFLAASLAHMVVDEVFDANGLDLALVTLACDAGVCVTLVGDPWQALYGFRGAKPDLVPNVMTQWGFQSLPLSHSFRFRSVEMRVLAEELRDSAPVALGKGGDHEVALASTWGALWSGPDHILPLSFGRTTNQNDAAAIVLLDHLVHSQFSERAIFLPEALILLGLDLDVYRAEGPTVLGGVVETLVSGSKDCAERALQQLRVAVKDLGAPRRPRAGSGDSEQKQVDRFSDLAARLRSSRTLVPGMTIHQAKGREWDNVGVRLSDTEIGHLAGGLDPEVETHRALYVALTRARYAVTALS
jgi:DNA helicase-2/ATP-dependent DNA helicase PcrA